MKNEKLNLFEEFAKTIKEQKTVAQQEQAEGKLKTAVDKYITSILGMMTDTTLVGKMKELSVKGLFKSLIKEVKAHPNYKNVTAVQISTDTVLNEQGQVVNIGEMETAQILTIAQIQAILGR